MTKNIVQLLEMLSKEESIIGFVADDILFTSKHLQKDPQTILNPLALDKLIRLSDPTYVRWAHLKYEKDIKGLLRSAGLSSTPRNIDYQSLPCVYAYVCNRILMIMG